MVSILLGVVMETNNWRYSFSHPVMMEDDDIAIKRGEKRSSDNIVLDGSACCSSEIAASVLGSRLLNACKALDFELVREITSEIKSLQEQYYLSGKNIVSILSMEDYDNKTAISYLAFNARLANELRDLIIHTFFEKCKKLEICRAHDLFEAFDKFGIKYQEIDHISYRKAYNKHELANINMTIKSMFKAFVKK